MKEDYRFQLNDVVEFDNGYAKGHGVIKGAATIGAPIIGKTYIIDVIESNLSLPNDEYPYTTISMFEIFLRHKAPYQQLETDENGKAVCINTIN